MFAGIIEDLATVESVELNAIGGVVSLKSGLFAQADDPIKLGDSIAVSGVCLTVVACSNSVSKFDISSETLRCTTLGELQVGDLVNLERSLKASARVDGHFVQGHVECVAEILSREVEGETERFLISLPSSIAPFVVAKGAIAIDGVSLTVGEVSESSFSVYLIPHTVSKTTFSTKQVGAKLNLESDVAARYAYKAVELLLAAKEKR